MKTLLLLAAAAASLFATGAEARGIKRFSTGGATAHATPTSAPASRTVVFTTSRSGGTAGTAAPYSPAMPVAAPAAGLLLAASAAPVEAPPPKPDWTASVPPCGKPEVTPCRNGGLIFLNATSN